MRIAMIAAEAWPLCGRLAPGGLSRELAQALAAEGDSVTVFLPLHRGMRANFVEVATSDRIVCRMHDGYEEATLLRAEHSSPGLEIFAIGADRYFDRTSLYGEGGVDYADSVRRFSFFCRAVLGSIVNLGLEPDLLHCQDWPAALLAVYLRGGILGQDSASLAVDLLRGSVVVSAVGEVHRQGVFSAPSFAAAGVPRGALAKRELGPENQINLLLEGVGLADHVAIVGASNPGVDLSSGLEEVLAKRIDSVTRIETGPAADSWNPAADSHLIVNYDVDSLHGKRRCKADLLVEADLATGLDTPVLAIVPSAEDMTRLAGLLPGLLERGLWIVVVDPEGLCRIGDLVESSGRGLDQLTICRDPEDSFLHKVYAGADFILVGSADRGGTAEAQAYGTVPIVFSDTDSLDRGSGGNPGEVGFRVQGEDPAQILEAVDCALGEFSKPDIWQALQRRCMQCDSSGTNTAAQYHQLYRRLGDT